MNTQLTRVSCTTLLCLSCIFVCYFQVSRKNQSIQNLQNHKLLNWQNKQINQYIAHRILLAPHKEPLGLSQWQSNKKKYKSFCETLQNSLKLPNQWSLISSLDSEWQNRLTWNAWLNSLTTSSEIVDLLKSSYLKIKALPDSSRSLCNLEISTRIADSNSLSTIIKFTSKNTVIFNK